MTSSSSSAHISFRLLTDEGRIPKVLARLGLAPDATLDQVKKRYIELARQHHPDRGGDVREMQKLNRLYDFLKKHMAR